MDIVAFQTFPEMMFEQARKQADRPFLYYNDIVFSYKKTYEIGIRLAAALQDLGLKKGEHVVICLPDTPEIILSFTGVGLAGGIFIPAEPSMKKKELLYQLEDSNAKFLITDKEHYELLGDSIDTLPNLSVRIQVGEGFYSNVHSWNKLAYGSEASYHDPEVSPDDLLMIIYTSGTTGYPKGAMIQQKRFLRNVYRVANQPYNLTRDDVIVNMLPFSHIFALYVDWMPALMAGASFVLHRQFNPRTVIADIKRHGGTVMAGVPTMYMLILDLLKYESIDISSLRVALVAAASIKREVQEEFEVVAGTTFVQAYGQTESGPLVLVEPFERPEGIHPGTCGKKIYDDFEIRLIDEHGLDVGEGEVGEIFFNSPDIMLGYWNKPEETEKAIENGWLHTGDLAYRDKDGYYYLVERQEYKFITLGNNVYPAEVEAVIKNYDGVRDVALFGVPDKLRGEVGIAYVLPQAETELDSRELLRYCRENLTDYKIPAKLYIVEQLPYTHTGKVRKMELRKEYLCENTLA